MTEKYTGTRDTTIEENTWGELHVSHWRAGGAVLGIEIVDDLREYFRDERDRELGRWRWPENPDYVVTPRTQKIKDRRVVRVVRESTGNVNDIREVEPIRRSDDSLNAAHAYFAAHPEKKPWHDARDGHVYLLHFYDFPETDVSALVKEGEFIYNDHCHVGVSPLDSKEIVSARRIWPESKES